ncbi:hypothetical protein AMS68_005149 [Peltaster fructicola]|uniref:E3 ubiquitin-protein ligase n=1 Tax=Peltaster fructicola TaxID=286661 RepID=A0A6H0XXY6_9PEZI|nr:hypothetical protein AMS68_005149 [Peltaster fructicola]
MTDLAAVQKHLNRELYLFAGMYHYRWDKRAERHLYEVLFRCLALNRTDYLYLFFGDNYPHYPGQSWSLRDAQGAKDGAEYTEAARGTTCGHIFKPGESTYACKTCAVDDTCVLCTRCFESTDHEGHQVYIQASPGNSGCCDCGDKEAWKTELICSIHSDVPGLHQTAHKDKGKVAQDDKQTTTLPKDLVDAMRMTISRCMDFLCDVFSCSPEQMRLAKSERSVKDDERLSQLSNHNYDVTDEEVSRGNNIEKAMNKETEYALTLWNDEKHSIDDVTEQVAKACRVPRSKGLRHAQEVNDVGRSVIMYSTDVPTLLRMAKVIEELKLTATIRSARDTFQEQMCATIIGWIADISPCRVGHDTSILRTIVCEELLNPWRIGSQAGNRTIARQGLDDHQWEDAEIEKRQSRLIFMNLPQNFTRVELEDELDRDADDQDPEDDEYEDTDANEDETMELEVVPTSRDDEDNMDVDAHLDEENDVLEAMEASLAGYPAPPLPPPPRSPTPPTMQAGPQPPRRVLTLTDSDDGEEHSRSVQSDDLLGAVPKTPFVKTIRNQPMRKPSRHWLETPDAYKGRRPCRPAEDLWQRVRLDWLIMYDLRLWKTLRISLRHLYISTVVVIPQFRRILGLRFATLHTLLSELYLIADREPDHSIINLSVQMLTTPSVTEEVVERCNFLTNLMATLYTFLTTRQVGYPEEVNPRAALALDSGTVTNRRIFHFFMDLRWLFQSEYIRWRIRTEPRYLLQFLDLAKLHQGICPNVRATGEHVEYESDAWISASLIIKEVNKLCRHISLSFKRTGKPEDDQHLLRAVRNAAQVAMINSFGYERKRFHQAELKSDLNFHTVGPFMESAKLYKVPRYVVQSESMSFHHPLHYLLSWLIESANALDRTTARKLLTFTAADLKDPFNNVRNAPAAPSGLLQDHFLAGLLDPPLRVCAWLAQTKAGMWVRNGITLRHQANSYRSVVNRDTGYQRDILLVQTGLTLIGEAGVDQGEIYLAQMIDRFQMTTWMTGDYSVVQGFEESQQLDVLEDLYHLLVIALSERGHLTPQTPENIAQEQHQPNSLSDRILQHDIAHALCFRPLPYSDLTGRVTEKVCDSERFSNVLSNMTTYKAPEGLSDTGTFELRPEYIELVDPYYAHYSRNLREEAENVYRKHMSRKTGKRPEDVVYEPHLERIESGIFQDLAGFTRSELFAQVLFAALDFAQTAHSVSVLPVTRIETFLHMVLHLTQIALLEEINSDTTAFTTNAATDIHKTQGQKTSIVKALMSLADMPVYATCRPTINHILHKILQRQPQRLSGFTELAQNLDRSAAGSPASLSVDGREKKKQEALARQARVMARFQQQQESFLRNQKLEGLEIEDDFEDVDDAMSITQDDATSAQEVWQFPGGTCILCQEETNDQRLYGTFAYLAESNILRTTPINDEDYINEVREMPENFDRPYHGRPYGVAGKNKSTVTRTNASGEVTQSTRYSLSRGFPQAENSFKGPVSTSCGHIMHFSCFELYFTATIRRHQQQIARNHPETATLMEFICPLCKALGNTFLPIIWKSKDCISSNVLAENESVESWITHHRQAFDEPDQRISDASRLESMSERCKAYVAGMFMPSLANSMSNLSVAAPEEHREFRREFRGIAGSRFFRGHPFSSVDPPAQLGRQTAPLLSHTDISKAYQRARETITSNKLDHTPTSEPATIGTARVLVRALATTISATEIASRGMASTETGTVLSDISEQTITHLRILAESFESYHGVEVLRSGNSSDSTRYELMVQQDKIRASLFPGTGSLIQGVCVAGDMFLFFNDWLAFFKPDRNEASAVMQICLWAEIVKVILAYKKWIRSAAQDAAPVTPQFERTVFDIYRAFLQHPIGQIEAFGPLNLTLTRALGHLRVLIDRYALAYLRKCLILMHIRYGFTFSDKQSSGSELDRITQLLHISPVSHWFDLFTSHSIAGERVRNMAEYWTMAACDLQVAGEPLVKVGHPAIFELVGLPKNFDILTEAAIKRRCPTTHKELTDPACCLFCGQIFCAQAVCCMKNNRGGCIQHMKTCASGKIGIFINIRKCMMLFMNGENGSWVNAPYLDVHGEADPTLRRHHQLFLNQRRYDKLMREVWLQHGVQNVISRKLEGDNNPGGWETL